MKIKKDYLILTINPGSTSTKIGVFKNENSIFETTVMHSVKMLEEYDKIWNQYSFRKHEIIEELEKNNIKLKDLDVVVGRGGLFKPIESGVYIVDENMIEVTRKDGMILTPDKLSGGTYDQLYFAIRLAIADVILKGDKGFFILDDPFIKADPDRLENLLNMVKMIVDQGWQVLYFSSKGEIRQLFEKNTVIMMLRL